MSINYLSESDTLARLTKELPPQQRQEIEALRHRRVEMGFKDRKFIVYTFNRRPEVLTTLIVRDFMCDDVDGCSFDLQDQRTGDHLIIGHTPKKLWNLPIYACVPCHPRLMYSLPEDEGNVTHSLAFPILLRTQSRLSLREIGTTYIETVKTFTSTFPDHQFV